MDLATVLAYFFTEMEFIYPGLLGFFLTIFLSIMVTQEISKKILIVMFPMAILITFAGVNQDPLTYIVLGLGYTMAIFDSRFLAEFVKSGLRAGYDRMDKD